MNDDSPAAWPGYIAAAKKIVSLMRDPTDEMEIAGEEQDYVGWLKEGDLRRFWQAMIDRALSEG